MKFVYVHVLKTAGTTLRHTLFERHYKGRYLYDDQFKLKRNKSIKTDAPVIIDGQRYPKDYEKYDVIFGHFKYDKYEHLKRPMFSFIRHPVDRMVSHYHYHKGVYKRKGIDLSLLEFSELWKNHMSYVLGDISQYKFIGIAEDFQNSLNRMCDILGVKGPIKIISKRIAIKSKAKNISKKIRKEIEQMNSEDMQLYHRVKKY
jgi:hypothetical protein